MSEPSSAMSAVQRSCSLPWQGEGWGGVVANTPLPASPLPGGGVNTLEPHKNGLMRRYFLPSMRL